jgi:SAM-dependent methyltransferase
MRDATLENLGAKTCPLCGASNNVTVLQLGRHTILRCKACTNARTYPPCDPQDYESEYFGKDNVAGANRAQRTKLSSLPKQWQKLVHMQLDMCSKFLPRGGRVLDIGCGDGMFIELLSQRGFVCQGIEPSMEASNLAVQAGLNVVRGYFPHPRIKGPFDLVTMTNVLEHLPDPKVILGQIAALAPGALLHLVQSNYRGFVPWTFTDRWCAWCPEGHFWHFTPAGLRRVLRGAGYRVKEIQYVSLAHGTRRYLYILPILDLLGRVADQFITMARIPHRSSDR